MAVEIALLVSQPSLWSFTFIFHIVLPCGQTSLKFYLFLTTKFFAACVSDNDEEQHSVSEVYLMGLENVVYTAYT